MSGPTTRKRTAKAAVGGREGQALEPGPDLIQRMRHDILSNRYNRGEWLRLVDLEERYGASRAEVRKSLATLATLKALEHVENYGYRVVVINEQQDRDNREVRYVLELAAAERIMATASPADLEPLRALAEQFAWSIENASLGGLDLANHQFHRALAKLCGNQAMEQLINDLREYLMPARDTPWSTITGMRRSAQEHFEMLDLIAAKDVEQFKVVLGRHIFRWNPADK